MEIKTYMDRFGQSAHFEDGEGQVSPSFRCFIQPLRYKNKMYLYGVNTQIGFNAQGHYLYIGPPDPDFTTYSGNVTLHVGQTQYMIDRAEKVYCGEELFYIWAIIRTVVAESEEDL